MPIIKSAKKRVRVARKAAVRNSKTKRSLREALKAFAKATSAGKSADIAKTQAEAMRAVDLAAKKRVIHKNKAARTKAMLSAEAKKVGFKPVKSDTKKPVAKKPVAKKSAAKKPAAKPKSK